VPQGKSVPVAVLLMRSGTRVRMAGPHLPRASDAAKSVPYVNMSTSQDEEDVWAWENIFGRKRGGVVVEVGGLDGLTYSNSFLFSRLLGWHAVLIEGSPADYEVMLAHRPEATMINAALCGHERVPHWIQGWPPENAGIYEFFSAGSIRAQFKRWARLNESDPAAAMASLLKIPCFPVTDVLLTLGIHHVDLWSLDVEGAELEVLTGWDPRRLPVDVILSEGAPALQAIAKLGYNCSRTVRPKPGTTCTLLDCPHQWLLVDVCAPRRRAPQR
jgi:hypothetical protein